MSSNDHRNLNAAAFARRHSRARLAEIVATADRLARRMGARFVPYPALAAALEGAPDEQ